ncbi:hypothetical protein ABL78_2094 [Leptomonas seymouri]|uniref:Uncharacterized protein n=1 Tax=Leptomonas seymouri TaxID=5684 RepID=A0A0N0P7G8_LEPSE|nr:hypothetical protein ABL78_2094 [Leptomonas seymouri]|eukprot:KPI88779.1 hypothetical protein ABL78_2094 [Leptomonas seymouri]
MGAVPSRESSSLFSYFRGSYEVGMVPLTKYYFGKSATEEAADSEAVKHPAPFPSYSTTAGDQLRCQLRQQLLLMRRDPAVLYANARAVDNILDSLLHRDADKEGSASDVKSKMSAMSSSTTTSKNGLTANVSPNHPGSPVTAFERAKHMSDSIASAATPTTSNSASDEDERKGLGNDIKNALHEELLRREYWSVMPNDSFSEQDLDRFLELVEETLFETNEELLAVDPISGVTMGDGEMTSLSPPAAVPEAERTGSKRPFLPVPCALCLAYPDGKERDATFSLDGRVVNIIGYFGLMTPAMQDAFKVVKRIPTSAEVRQKEELKKQQTGHGDEEMQPMLLNTAILTSAGDRTLERVLVLAAVMLRQQFHTVGRRHILQTRLDQLLRRQQQQQPISDLDLQMLKHLQSILAIPHTSNAVLGAQAVSADGVQLPYFDPLLQVPLPSIPRGIYKPTHYINAASSDLPRQPSSTSNIGRASFNGSASENSLLVSASASVNAVTAATGHSTSPMNMRSAPHGESMVHGAPVTPSAIAAPESLPGSVSALPLPMPGSLGGPTCSLHSGLQTQQQQQQLLSSFPASLPLDQSDEDAITMAFCRRMEKCVVLIEAASNNYSALKALTENFAFLHCQIVLDQSLTQMELIDLPGLSETPSFKPLASALTPMTTLKAGTPETNDGDDRAEDVQTSSTAATTTTTTATSSTADPLVFTKDGGNVGSDLKSLANSTFSPHSAVVIRLNPSLVRQATMWASSFFHCPTLLPTGNWIKYKLKDECDQLRHVLQNKDMLIAHWRKTDADSASRYLGVHTDRLLEHVRALQAETEEARALPADYWAQRPLFVNQDGRKYALFQSRYGTMLIGVRAFSAGSTPSASLAPEERASALVAGVKAGQSGTAAPNPSRSAGNTSNYSNAIHRYPSNTAQAHNAGRANNAGTPRGKNNNAGGSGSGNCSTDECNAVLRCGAQMQSNGVNQSLFVTGSGTYMPFMAPPPDAVHAGCTNAYYGAIPLMMSQGGYSAGNANTGTPHFYTCGQMVSLGCNNSSSYGSKQNIAVSYVPSPSLNELPPGMMYRGPPPPPHMNLSGTNATGGSCGSVPTLMTAGTPQYIDPSRVIMSSSVDSSNIAAASGVESANVLHLIPQSCAYSINQASPFFGLPQNAPAAVGESGSTATLAAPTKAQVPASAPLHQSSTASPPSPKIATPKISGSTNHSKRTTISHTPQQHQPRETDQHSSMLHMRGAAPDQTSNPIPQVPLPATVTANASDLARRSTTLPLNAPPRSSPPSGPHVQSHSSLHSPPHPTPRAAHDGSSHPTSAITPLFSPHSIWAPYEPSPEEGGNVVRGDHGSGTGASAAAQLVSAIPLPQHPLDNSGAGDSLAQLRRLSTQSPIKRQTPMPAQAAGTNITASLRPQKAGTAQEDTAGAQQALETSLPWALHPVAEFTRAEDTTGATPSHLLRGTEMLDVDDDDNSGKAYQRNLHLSAGSAVVATGPTAASRLPVERVRNPQSLIGAQDEVTRSLTATTMSEQHQQKLSYQPSESNASTTGSLPEHPHAFSGPSATASYVPMPPRIATPPQNPSTGAAYPLYARQAPQSMSSLFPPQQQPAGSQSSSSASMHTPTALVSNNLYYAVVNGAPMLVQPPTTPGGMAMAFPLSVPVAHGDSAFQTCAAPQTSPPQQWQHGQLQPAAAPPFTAHLGNAQAMPQSSLHVAAESMPPQRTSLHNLPPSQGSSSTHNARAMF